ncbi:hypothetical protein BDV18DRAFT_128648 [Aspergillus unguis]
MIPSSSTSSNWDFTPVFDLLRAPTCPTPTKGLPTRDSSPNHPDSSRLSHKITQHDVSKSTHKGEHLNDADVSSPKLGDFGALWELLGSTRTPASSNEACHSKPRGLPQQACSRPVTIVKRPTVIETPDEKTKPITILKKPTVTEAPVDNTASTLNGPLKPITQSDALVKRRRRRNKTKHEAISSDSAEGDSDDPPSIFEPSLSHPKSAFSMVPPQVGVSETRAGSLETPPSSFEDLEFSILNTAGKSRDTGAQCLQSLAYKTTADQRVGLLTKLLKDFPDYAETLVQAGRSTKSKKLDTSTRPIHVFVDMSNISVGFHDTMKVSRNIPVETRIRRLPLSYQSFSLILERGRCTAKRVLVGSDRVAAISESEELGYEANILNRVQKFKQPTARQLKFRKGPKATQDGGHVSETNDFPEERWVEQGVDEILHLKILESLLDTVEPATIVLATGDAAEAEFSGGFMKMVERALQRGWNVELVSFSQVMSYAYRKKEFRSRWGNQFKVFLLDDYVEELLKV